METASFQLIGLEHWTVPDYDALNRWLSFFSIASDEERDPNSVQVRRQRIGKAEQKKKLHAREKHIFCVFNALRRLPPDVARNIAAQVLPTAKRPVEEDEELVAVDPLGKIKREPLQATQKQLKWQRRKQASAPVQTRRGNRR